MARVIKFDLRIDWDFNGVYDDESARLVAANGALRLAAPESGITSPRGTVDQCTLTLANQDGRYSPLNTASPLYGSIAGGGAYHAPMYLRVSIDNGATYQRVFTGVIKIPTDAPPYPGSAGQITVDCRSRDEILLNKRLSTLIYEFQGLHDSGATEAVIMANFLTAAGLAPTDYALDGGLFVIPWAWLDDESPIEDIWQMAAACGGRFYCDADGIFRYENMTHWLFAPHNTSQETLLDDGYGQLDGPEYDDRELYSGVTVVASPRDFMPEGAMWSPESSVTVPAASAITLTARLRQPAYKLTGLTFNAASAGGRPMAADITIGTMQYAQRCEITLTNSNPTYAAELVDMVLTGIAVNGGPTVEEVRASTAAFWTSHPNERPGRTRLVRGNVYIQTQAQAAALAEFLRDRYQTPRLSYHLKNVPGDPLRRLGNRVTVGNSQVMSANRQGFITTLIWRLSDRGFVQDIELIDAAGLYAYGNPGDATGYFVLDVNTLGTGGGLNARIFY